MVGDLITFPLRLGWRAARAAVRGGVQASERAVSVASFLVKSATSTGPGEDRAASDAASESRASEQQRPSPPAPQRPSPPAPDRAAATETPGTRSSDAPDTAPPAPIASRPGDAQPLPEAEPAHVSEEPTLVEAFAEPGAENGAGAQVTIAEPWEGYRHMNAKDVIARVSDANAVELAAVQLYEAAHRSRETVMTAVERELRAKSGRGAATAAQTRKEHTNGG